MVAPTDMMAGRLLVHRRWIDEINITRVRCVALIRYH